MRFQEITGHETVKKHLTRTVAEHRVSHAQLFLGPGGTGKLALAVAYAQFINCRDKQNVGSENADSCGKCPSCLKYQQLAHPDLHFIFPVAPMKNNRKPRSRDFMVQWRKMLLDNNFIISLDKWYGVSGIEKKQGIINADDCSDILNTLSYKSYESEYKVMILWSVDKLYHSAAPKILKILEEPPEKTLFLLISENQHQIINTILSRTQIVKIPKLDEEEIKGALQQKYGASPDEATQIAALSDGNLLHGIELLRNKEEQEERLGQFIKWMRLCYSAKVFELNEFVNELSKIGREKLKHFLAYSSSVMRNAMAINNEVINTSRTDPKETEFLRNFSPFVTNKNIPEIAGLINQSQYHIERNANPQITLMNLSLQLYLLLRYQETDS